MIAENKYYSYNTGKLPKGCEQCVRGEKLVLFVTGICPRTCYFCPVSDEKYQHDVMYANERKITQDNDIIEEANMMNAKGAGITGGDPLTRLQRTCTYIRTLKQTRGKQFHIHLYTSLNLINEKTLQQLYDAGLDEIRFHLDLDDNELWPKIILARAHPWIIGVELPLVPTKEQALINILDYIHDKVDFLNLNELELADNNHSTLRTLGFHSKDGLSYAVKGSLELGQKLIQHAQKMHYALPIHACTAKLKDAIQLARRIHRQSKNAKRVFDKVTREGLLIRGAIYLPELTPSFGYRKLLASADKTTLLHKLNHCKNDIAHDLHLTEDDILIDDKKLRILLSSTNAKQHADYFKKHHLTPATVTEYPTADQLEIEIEFH